jgi:glc operon protein GlcG
MFRSLVLVGAAAGSISLSIPVPEPASASPETLPAVAARPGLTLAGASAALNAAMADARSRGASPSIAVVDESGVLLAFARADGSFAAGAQVSIGKARTAALFKKPTRVFEDSINKGRVALLDATTQPDFTPLQGGVPVVVGGVVVGAVGVSGAASAEQDEQVAMAGAAAIAGAITKAGGQ